MRIFPLTILVTWLGCGFAGNINLADDEKRQDHSVNINDSVPAAAKFEKGSWQHFLQNLSIVDEPILDYKGERIANQDKHIGIIPFDVGKRDLQQCADAIMRLRAEYLFSMNRIDEIGFHFTSGQLYRFNDYCNGKIPVPKGNKVVFVNRDKSERNKFSLRKYLDLVYTYAGTISLAKELKTADDFGVGAVVIYAGSPGHCFIIIDESINEKGEKVFKLAEGYTPAQSIYVLRNIDEPGRTPWHKLTKGTIRTASYVFEEYKLGKFE